MDTIETALSSTSFLLNVLELKSRMKDPLPTDVIVLRCGSCQTNIPFNSCGSIIIDKSLKEEFSNILNEMLECMKENHTRQNECSLADIHIHPILGPPANICVTLPASDPKYLNKIQLGGMDYKAKLLIVNSESEVVFALYQNEIDEKTIYSEFIKCNFNTMLNIELNEIEEMEIVDEDLIYDDESVSTFQQMLPRVAGGGRTLRADYNYVCLWCPKEDIKKGKRGCFRELKNYRDHFKKYHHGKDEDGIPMSEFIKKLNRCEPTWFCKNCRQHYSVGNKVRHKAICHLESSDSDTDSDTEEQIKGSKRTRSRIGSEKKNRTIHENKQKEKRVEKRKKEDVAGTSGMVIEKGANMQENSESDTDSDIDSDSIRTQHGKKKENCIAGTSGLDIMNKKGPNTDNSNTDMAVEMEGLINLHCNPKSQLQKRGLEEHSSDENKNKGDHLSTNSSLKNIIVIEPQNEQVECSVESMNEETQDDCIVDSGNQKKLKTRFSYEDVHDEVYISSEEEESEERNVEIKIELTEDEKDNCERSVPQEHLTKWWDQIEKNLYSDRGLGGPKILLPTDSEEFVRTVTENYQKHLIEKSRLDEQMLLAESGDAKFQQFSIERDQPFVDKYRKFVISLTAKDVMHFFSDDYEELDIPQEAKSSTAKQYTNRIMEFFKYLASVYKNFHFDWMLDFKDKIEKSLQNGEISNEIFLPTKQDVTNFIKQFKYGSNPAANCGVRIFALKKLMDFLSQEVKDNEHQFEGTLIEKSSKVECLLQKLKNLNLGICPDGTIKHLATASNKSHKRTLVEQVLKCPEKSISAIMKGVSEYLESDEFDREKTKLMELAYKKSKVPSAKEYVNSTNWLLEMLVCIGGNRPCALLGITLRDWEERRPGYCPFYQNEDNDLEEEDPNNERRKVLKDPYSRPKGSSDEDPTGVIVKSETDKIIVGPPCYIWFPNALVDLVKAHALLTEKVLPRSVDIYHPKTRLFLNSNGKQIKTIECRHLKSFIGLPIVAYDFRRSLSTFVLDSTDDKVRQQESSVLRHQETTGYAYYYQKHSDNIEYVSIQYAMQNSLVKASSDSVDEYCQGLKKDAANQEWELSQKRTDKSLEYSQQIIEKRKQGLRDAKQKGARNWILPAEYDSFVEGIEEAIQMEERKNKNGETPGPFSQLLKYKIGTEGAGVFPPAGIWFFDMYRVLYGLKGKKGDEMRRAELSVYDGVPFSYSGRKKIKAMNAKSGAATKDGHSVIANYWREKIRREATNRIKGRWLPLRFIFSETDMEYQKEYIKRTVKTE